MSREGSRDESVAVVNIPAVTEPQLSPRCCGSVAVYRSLLIIGNFLLNPVLDFLRITFVTAGLLARWSHQLILLLKHYDAAPSKWVQQSWMGLVIFGVGAFSSVGIKFLNYCFGKPYYQDYLFSLFSSSLLYIFLDVISAGGSVGIMPVGWFITTSAIFIPLLAAFFLKIAHPDSHHEIIASLTQLNQFAPPAYPHASIHERRLNAASSVVLGATSLSTVLWTINRELYGQTVGLPTWQKGLIFLYLLVTGKIGFEETHHPKFFQTFVAFSKMLKEGALTYSVMSGLFSSMLFYQCNGQDVCMESDPRRMLLSYLCFAMGLFIGLYSAATTRVQFEKNHESNEDLIAKIQSAPEKIKSGCYSAYETVTSGVSGCAHFFAEKVRQCCSRDATVDAAATEPLAVASS